MDTVNLNIVENNACSIRLCVLAGASCWVLYVDVLVLEMGGEKCNWWKIFVLTLENAPHPLLNGDGGCALAESIQWCPSCRS